MTPSETALWGAVRAKRFKGLHFRRQHPFGPYILDFYCDATKLAVEVDGGVHQGEEQMMRDAARDAWVAQHGVRTLRLPARLVVENVDAALGLIAAELGWRGPGYPFG
jgi:very-short-patch-repair endonuclease